jgi:hypothetical protein
MIEASERAVITAVQILTRQMFSVGALFIGGSWSTRVTVLALELDELAVHTENYNDVDVYYSVHLTQPLSDDVNDFKIFGSSRGRVEVDGHIYDINWVHISPVTLGVLISCCDIDCCQSAMDVTNTNVPTLVISDAFQKFLDTKIIRGVNVISEAATYLRLQVKSRQMGLRCDVADLDPTRGVINDDCIEKKLSALRSKQFPQPESYENLELREMLGGPANTYEFFPTEHETYWGMLVSYLPESQKPLVRSHSEDWQCEAKSQPPVQRSLEWIEQKRQKNIARRNRRKAAPKTKMQAVKRSSREQSADEAAPKTKMQAVKRSSREESAGEEAAKPRREKLSVTKRNREDSVVDAAGQPRRLM